MSSLNPSNAARSLGWTSSWENDKMGVTMGVLSGIASETSFFWRKVLMLDEDAGGQECGGMSLRRLGTLLERRSRSQATCI